MEQPTKTSTPVSHRVISRFESMRLAETLTRNDLIDASTAELYAAVMEHWRKCTPCAKRELLESSSSPIRDNAKLMQKIFDITQSDMIRLV
ncbi:hypothetical protein N7388_22940 [Stutzerimonas stutzeri]|uniref:hypothetical protein n=1 Tax=Stutzerimonas stutzeri TaxID=316 RepID=UPI00244AD36B|nr:hypothetical protein [Stutzerimonas stutzeri]MDH0446518.1 hypothetical protein [Stutzerimonas stutzeri]